MKKFLLPVFILLSTQLFSQTNFRFADSTAQWNELYFNYNYPNHVGTTVWVVCGDTLINGRMYQSIGAQNNHPLIYYRRDSLNQIFAIRYTTTPDYKIYDFGKNIGDTTTIGDLHSNLVFYHFIIDSITNSFLGIQRKAFYVTPIEYPWSHDVWIEGIGSLYTELLSPSAKWENVGGDGYNLLCYFENGQRVYHNNNYPDTCLINSPLGVKNLEEMQINFSPNPATSFLTIQSENNFPEQTSFQLFDITGRMVLQKQLTQKNTQLDVSGMSKGMYLYNISSSNQKLGSGKLVIE